MNPTKTTITKNGRETMDVLSLEFQDRNIYLVDEINYASATEVISQLRQLDKTNGDITLWINSPGGSVSAGLSILDCMNLCKNDVSTVCVGLAASMGAFLLSCGAKGKRYVSQNAEIMIHQPIGGTQGQASDIELEAKHIIRTKHRLNAILAQNTGKDIDRIAVDTDRDNWLNAQEAVEYGLADQILTKGKGMP